MRRLLLLSSPISWVATGRKPNTRVWKPYGLCGSSSKTSVRRWVVPREVGQRELALRVGDPVLLALVGVAKHGDHLPPCGGVPHALGDYAVTFHRRRHATAFPTICQRGGRSQS